MNLELGSTRQLHDGAQITLAPSRVGTVTLTVHTGGAASAHVHLTPAEARQIAGDLAAIGEHVARLASEGRAAGVLAAAVDLSPPVPSGASAAP